MKMIASMSESWKSIDARLHYNYHIMLEHLAKIFYYRDFTNYLRGWKTSCRKGFEKVPRCKNTNRYPEFKKLYESLWLNLEDVFDERHDSIIEDINYDKEYDDLPDVEELSPRFKPFCKEYVENLCGYISENGGISSEENSELIDELLDKFGI